MEDLEIEVEYQFGTIGKYDLGFDGHNFILLTKQTDCLAKENCGVPEQKLQLSDLQNPCCSPDGNCC